MDDDDIELLSYLEERIQCIPSIPPAIPFDDRRLRYAFSDVKSLNHWTEMRNIQKEIENDPSFLNPNCLEDMLASFHVNLQTCTLIEHKSMREDGYYENIRELQNKKWAELRLLKGVSLAKEKKFHEAIKCYDQAIATYADNADVYTARGAALANLQKLKEAVADLQKAIKIDPDHPNAKVYLEAVYTKEPSLRKTVSNNPVKVNVIKVVEEENDDVRLKELIKKDGGVDKMYDLLIKKSSKKSKKKHKSEKKKKRKRESYEKENSDSSD